MGLAGLRVTESRQVAGPTFFSFGRSEEEKELSEFTEGGFKRPRQGFVKPTADTIREGIKSGLGKLGQKETSFKESKLKRLNLNPTLNEAKTPKFKKSNVEKLIGI